MNAEANSTRREGADEAAKKPRRVTTHDGCPQPRPEWVPDNAGREFATWIIEGVRPLGAIAENQVPHRQKLELEDYEAGVVAGDRAILARAITLIESQAPHHQEQAQQLLTRLLPRTGKSRRIGITGIPGAGKSSLIETLGCQLSDTGHRIAVLAVDPSSSLTGGSILADKVRMTKLGLRSNAFIRPSPSSGTLGGVARKTRETMLLCEAAGYDTIFVETVGVGQSEIAVRSMTDFFLVVLIAGAGDELQGIKKGVIEIADAIAINKADGENYSRAFAAQVEMARVLQYIRRTTEGWRPTAVLTSASTGLGVPELWRTIEAFCQTAKESGEWEARRRVQLIEWLHSLIQENLRTRFYSRPGIRQQLVRLENAVASGKIPPLVAAGELFRAENGGETRSANSE